MSTPGTPSQEVDYGQDKQTIPVKEVQVLPKLHTLTVCMVPPPSNQHVWKVVTEMREMLQDPGFYRWPPHVNLLYPFLDFTKVNITATKTTAIKTGLFHAVEQLREVTRQCAPFEISLDKFGTFGGNQRGVLFLYPNSRHPCGKNEESEQVHAHKSSLPLMQLHAKLEEAFPMCNDLSQKAGGGGGFSPHMTLSHFESLQYALEAQATLESRFSLRDLTFVLDRIYLLSRRGDTGQFQRVADIYLGDAAGFYVFDPPRPFPDMPLTEAGWVCEKRMGLKKRRKRGHKRADRKAKRDQHTNTDSSVLDSKAPSL